MINTALSWKEDQKEGTKDKACKEGEDIKHCFNNVAQFKRIYKVKLDDKTHEAQKISYIDLLNIKDKNKIAKRPLVNDKFVFPFETIEGVDIVDDSHIVVKMTIIFLIFQAEPNKTDDNEFILV